ncbi:hypothetical protein E2542_SST25940 [Spatholobus suberectus]|nr:hypothetical protein E2542_SST25940 [Spatholobus suberectus]
MITNNIFSILLNPSVGEFSALSLMSMLVWLIKLLFTDVGAGELPDKGVGEEPGLGTNNDKLRSELARVRFRAWMKDDGEGEREFVGDEDGVETTSSTMRPSIDPQRRGSNLWRGVVSYRKDVEKNMVWQRNSLLAAYAYRERRIFCLRFLYTIPANTITLAATITPIANPAFLLPLNPPLDEFSVLSSASTPVWFIELLSAGELPGDGAGEDAGLGVGGDEPRGELAGAGFGAWTEGDGDGEGESEGDGAETARCTERERKKRERTDNLAFDIG